MKRAWALAAGAAGGFLLAGLAAPAVIVLFPPGLRGEPLLLGLAAVLVPMAVFATWWATSTRR